MFFQPNDLLFIYHGRQEMYKKCDIYPRRQVNVSLLLSCPECPAVELQTKVREEFKITFIMTLLGHYDKWRLGKRISPNTTEIYNCVV